MVQKRVTVLAVERLQETKSLVVRNEREGDAVRVRVRVPLPLLLRDLVCVDVADRD